MSIISAFKKSFVTSLASLDWTNLSDIVKLQLHITDFGARAVAAMQYEGYDNIAGEEERKASLGANATLSEMTRLMLTKEEYNVLQPMIVASVNEYMHKQEQEFIDNGYETEESIAEYHKQEEAFTKLMNALRKAVRNWHLNARY